jgi:hypothetical protein
MKLSLTKLVHNPPIDPGVLARLSGDMQVRPIRYLADAYSGE